MRALLDTSVVIDPRGADFGGVDAIAISTITLAELGVGVVQASDDMERVKRTIILQRVRAAFEELVVDAAVAEAYVLAATAMHADGRSPRPRAFDLLIAATAIAHDLPLFTRDVKDVLLLRHLIDIRPVPAHA